MALTQVPSGMLSPELQATTYGFKNRIINGDMRIDQRKNGASTAGNGSPTNVYAVDRTFVASYTGQSGNTTVTGQRVAVTDSSIPHDFAIRATIGNTASRGTNYDARFQHNIEGNMIADFQIGNANATAFTVSFWVRGSKAGRSVYQIWGAGMTHTFAKVVNITTSWQKVIIQVPALTASGNTPNKDNSRGFGTGLYWAASIIPTSTDGTWATAHASTNYDDFSTSGDWIEFTGYQLEKGTVATQFDFRPFGVELTLCQRYYQKSFSPSTVPANQADASRAIYAIGGRMQVADVTGLRSGQISFANPMRTAPTLTFYNSQSATGVAQFYTQSGTSQDSTTFGPVVTSEVGFAGWQYTGVTAGTVGDLVQIIFHYTADAEM